MIDQNLEQQIEQAAEAARQIEQQRQIEQLAESLPELRKEAQRQANIQQGEAWLNDSKQQAQEQLPAIKQRVEAWHSKIAQIEQLVNEVISERQLLNNETRQLALGIKRSCDFIQSQFTSFNPEYDFSIHWKAVEGESFDLRIHTNNDQLKQAIDKRNRGAYDGSSRYWLGFGM